MRFFFSAFSMVFCIIYFFNEMKWHWQSNHSCISWTWSDANFGFCIPNSYQRIFSLLLIDTCAPWHHFCNGCLCIEIVMFCLEKALLYFALFEKFGPRWFNRIAVLTLELNEFLEPFFQMKIKRERMKEK